MMLGKIALGVRNAWLMVGITILLFCLIEGGFSFALWMGETEGSVSSSRDDRASADAYADAPWATDYFEEFRRSHSAAWRPYVYWRRKAWQGDYVNVDAEGRRRTTASELAQGESDNLVKIFVFGGSTVWGTGARDDFTIPSLLAKGLDEAGVAADVVNLGESGYVSTQGLVTLLLQLQQREIPDVVIFYDGVNDTYSAYQQGVAGIPQNEFNRVREFNLTLPGSFARRRKMILQDLSERLSTTSFLVERMRGRNASDTTDAPLVAGAAREDELAEAVVSVYAGNIDIVQALAERYGFGALFYWQPNVFEKTHLTPFEAQQRDRESVSEPFFRKTYERVRRGELENEPGFHDMSRVFADVRDPIFLDWSHISEAGNAAIAKRMTRDVGALLAARNTAQQVGAGQAIGSQ